MSEQRSFRNPREISPESPAGVYGNELAGPRRWLDRLRVHHVDLVMRFLKVADRQLYTLDLFFGAAMARSYSLVDGFISAFDTWNPVVAAPILRMELDTLVRVAYVAQAPRADEVAFYIIKGGEFRHLRDAANKRLTDARLLEHVATTHPWVRDVYKATSGWVHFSPAHLRAAWQLRDDEPDETGAVTATLSGSIPIRPEQIPLSALQELLGAMIQATSELFAYSEIWESRKGLPSGEMRELRPEEPGDG